MKTIIQIILVLSLLTMCFREHQNATLITALQDQLKEANIKAVTLNTTLEGKKVELGQWMEASKVCMAFLKELRAVDHDLSEAVDGEKVLTSIIKDSEVDPAPVKKVVKEEPKPEPAPVPAAIATTVAMIPSTITLDDPLDAPSESQIALQVIKVTPEGLVCDILKKSAPTHMSVKPIVKESTMADIGIYRTNNLEISGKWALLAGVPEGKAEGERFWVSSTRSGQYLYTYSNGITTIKKTIPKFAFSEELK